jgi:DNA adenine methylase
MLSPLRYPGGKAKLFPFFSRLISENGLYDRTYAEPYAGGAGLALKLLAHGFVRQIELNDIDPAIAAFWRSALYQSEVFCSLIADTALSVDEWRKQRAIYNDGLGAGEMNLGFAAYYLNRTSRSGIIEGAGPIGGYLQSGEWKIDARFNKKTQIAQIKDIARFRNFITVRSLDALDFISSRIESDDYFIYLDPPYYVKGSKLYKNFYKHEDHIIISNLLKENRNASWILSYDNASQIVDMYSDFQPTIYNLQYSAGASGTGEEVIFVGDKINLPAFRGFRLVA